MRHPSSCPRLLAAAALAFVALHAAWAARAAVGTPVADAELPTLQGGTARLLGDGVNVLVFYRTGQDRSASALRELTACRRALAGKPVRWVGVVADAAVPKGAADATGAPAFDAPTLVDRGDEVYGRLGLALHPVVAVVARDRTLAALEPYRSVDYCAVVTARVRHALGEIGEAELRAALEPPKSAEGGDEQVAARYRALAQLQLRAGSLDKARESVQRSLERHPKAAASHALLGEVLAAQGQCAQARQAFREALALEPANAAALAGLERCGNAR